MASAKGSFTFQYFWSLIVFKNHMDKTELVDILCLHFQKAFDKVPHQRLLSKLYSHGIRAWVLPWISNWLKNRRQRRTKWTVTATEVSK